MKARVILFVLALVLAAVSLWRLEAARSGIEISRDTWDGTPVTTYQAAEAPETLAIISHGFAGSRQMMEAISLTLARAGHHVVAFDYLGHGRNAAPLSRDIEVITGTTEDLVQQTLDVTARARAETGIADTALIGHSMATDVVVRAAQRLDDIAAVAAISMYSEAVTPTQPERLLILSGAQEARLRGIARDVVGQIGPAEEDQTVRAGPVERRAVAAPYVGHVGVLWSPTTSREIAAWLGLPGTPKLTGPWIGALLAAIVASFWSVSALFPRVARPKPPPLKRALLASVAPVPVVLALSFLNLPAVGLAGFGTFALMLAAWGGIASAVFRHIPRSPVFPALIAGGALLVWGVGLFALALDRYGAAFVPTGPRLSLFMVLLPATLLFITADRAICSGRPLGQRLLLRIPVFFALLAGMILNIGTLGLLFTILPVFVLFLAVYGTMAMWASRHAGPMGPTLASGVIWAWAIAASTPLFGA